MPKTLYLVRHGQTFFNVRRVIQGWCDSPLTDRGIAQAVLARDWIEGHDITFDHAYSSSAERACDTLEVLTRESMPYVRSKGLKEFRYGTLEGCPYDLFFASPEKSPYGSYGDWLVQFGGDTEATVAARMTATLTEIMERPDHHSVLAVSHGACIRCFTSAWDAHNQVHVNMVTKNCSIYTFTYEDGIFSLVDLFEPDDSVLD